MAYDREARSEAAKRGWADPEVKAKRIAGMLASWDDPVRLAMARRPFQCGHEETDANLLFNGRCRACKLARQSRWQKQRRIESPEYREYRNAVCRAWRAEQRAKNPEYRAKVTAAQRVRRAKWRGWNNS